MKTVAPVSSSRHRMPPSRLMMLVLALPLAATPALAFEHYEGEAFAVASGLPLYSESHWRYEEDGVAAGLVLYRCPDGSPFARKRLRSVNGAQTPDFELLDARSGYAEGVRSDGAKRQVFVRTNARTVERVAPLGDGNDLVIDAGFDAFVHGHWDTLNRAAASVQFVVPSRLEALRFQVRRVGEERVGDRLTQRFRLSLASWYGGLLPHIDVVYDDSTHRLLRYEGISNVRDANAHNIGVRIEFPPQERDSRASAADIEAAAAAPLTGTCTLS